MKLIEQIRAEASKLNKSIILPESGDLRTLKAAQYLHENKILRPILIGKADEVRAFAAQNNTPVSDDIAIINPAESPYWKPFSESLFESRKHKGLSAEAAESFMKNELFFGAAMVKHGYADGCVAGAVNTTGDVLRAAIQVIGLKKGSKVVSSVFLMSFSDGQVLTYGDCAVVPYPDSGQLASIAVDSAQTHFQLTGQRPVVAMLSFSTKGSAKHPNVDLVLEAVSQAKMLAPELSIDGELQFDAAFVPEIGRRKAPDSKVAGKANVYIFPNLDAGNIAYKITERIGGATATGPIIQGLAAPMNDLSRGASWEDIVNTSAVSVLQSVSA